MIPERIIFVSRGIIVVGISCVYVYAVVFSWYLVRVSVRSGVLGVGVVMHVMHLLDEMHVV